MYDGAYR